jgi:hypothetical protein
MSAGIAHYFKVIIYDNPILMRKIKPGIDNVINWNEIKSGNLGNELE